jgi:hypothetical protein
MLLLVTWLCALLAAITLWSARIHTMLCLATMHGEDQPGLLVKNRSLSFLIEDMSKGHVTEADMCGARDQA